MAKQVHIKKLLRSEDAFLTTSERAYNFFLLHTRHFAAGAVILAVVLAAILIGRQVYLSNLKEAAQASQAAMFQPDPASAVQDLTEVLEKYSDTVPSRPALLTLSQAQYEMQEYAQAAENLEKALVSISPDSDSLQAQIHLSLGQCYENLGNFEKAIQNYRTAQALIIGAGSVDLDAALFPASGEASMDLARAYAQTGQLEQARQSYENILLQGGGVLSYRRIQIGVILAQMAAAAAESSGSPAAGDNTAAGPVPAAAGDNASAAPAQAASGDNASAAPAAAGDNASAAPGRAASVTNDTSPAASPAKPAPSRTGRRNSSSPRRR
ncbi:MAG: tetratricopeptide repeat protein [Deltaproteobacteria bacterium]|jgi:tetratricopeptide (TPR) repeat protein|nr:tetratricopeptide repeat protein [Deltaproteobacteria bacterium]